jgi:hypothetical protein
MILIGVGKVSAGNSPQGKWDNSEKLIFSSLPSPKSILGREKGASFSFFSFRKKSASSSRKKTSQGPRRTIHAGKQTGHGPTDHGEADGHICGLCAACF